MSEHVELNKHITNESGFSSYDYPEIPLYHYTDEHGLLGIIDKSFWLTHYKYLNDPDERRWGIDIFYSELEKWRPKSSFQLLVVDYLKRGHLHLSKSNELFFFCMCENGNLLNQWRYYTGSKSAFSLEIDYYALSSNKTNNIMMPCKIIYKEDEQRRYCSSLISAIMSYSDAVSDKYQDDLGGRTNYLYEISSSIEFYLQRLKNPAFEQEMEWRYVVSLYGEERKRILFRPGRYGLTPYVSVSFIDGTVPPPVQSIRVGPGPNSEEAKYALDLLLYSKGLSIPTSSTDIRLRS